MSPEGPIRASVGVQVSWYCCGDQFADFSIATLPTTGTAPLPANHDANPAPPRAATSLPKRDSRSSSSALPLVMVGSARGLGMAGGAAGSSICPTATQGAESAATSASEDKSECAVRLTKYPSQGVLRTIVNRESNRCLKATRNGTLAQSL